MSNFALATKFCDTFKLLGSQIFLPYFDFSFHATCDKSFRNKGIGLFVHGLALHVIVVFCTQKAWSRSWTPGKTIDTTIVSTEGCGVPVDTIR